MLIRDKSCSLITLAMSPAQHQQGQPQTPYTGNTSEFSIGHAIDAGFNLVCLWSGRGTLAGSRLDFLFIDFTRGMFTF